MKHLPKTQQDSHFHGTEKPTTLLFSCIKKVFYGPVFIPAWLKILGIISEGGKNDRGNPTKIDCSGR